MAASKSRNSFSKDFFGKNSILKETFWQSRRELQSSIAAVNGKPAGEQAASSTSAPTATSTPAEDDVLPHRRRKRAKELAAQQHQSQYQSQEQDQQQQGAEAYTIPLDASAQLADRAAAQTSFKRLFFTYLSLSKPRLSFLVVLTATATYSLYPVPQLLSAAATSTPSLSALTLLFLTTGTALCSASANAFNMLMEPKFDAQMTRTRNRPLVRKLISTRGATVFAVACGVVGTAADVVAEFKAGGYDPEGYTLYTYAAIQAFADAARKAGSTDPEAVAKALKEGNYETVLGSIAFNEKGDVKNPDYVMYIWKDGQYGEL